MKRFLVAGLVAGLVLSTFVAPGVAKKKPKKPVATSLWFHGANPAGEVDTALQRSGNGTFMPMDAVAPTGSGASMGITSYVVGPVTDCTANNLFPVWLGDLTGTIKGDIKVTLFTTAGPGTQVDVRVWPDVTDILCDADYVPAAREVTVDIPQGDGKVEAVLSGTPVKVVGKLLVQVQPVEGPLGAGSTSPFLARISYDSPTKNSGMTFGCVPPKGLTSCTP